MRIQIDKLTRSKTFVFASRNISPKLHPRSINEGWFRGTSVLLPMDSNIQSDLLLFRLFVRFTTSLRTYHYAC